MDTRVIKTKFWQDEKIQSLACNSVYLFIYLLTCPYINKTGIFELSANYILLETKLSLEEFGKAKKELSDNKKVFFFNGWIWVVNALKHNRYDVGKLTSIGFRKELENIPKNIIAWCKKLINSSIELSDTTIAEYINNKTKTINNKTKKGKEEEINVDKVIEDMDNEKSDKEKNGLKKGGDS